MRFNFSRMLANLIANSLVNPTKTTYKPSSTSSYLTNKAIRTVRRNHFKLWK